MKLSLAVLALIAPAEACPFKAFKHWMHKPAPLAEFQCDYDTSGDMDNEKYVTTFAYTIYKSFLEGLYDGGVDGVTDQCFMGDKQIQSLKNINAFKHKLIEGDFFNITINEALKIANDHIEAIWYNVDQCHMMVPVTDIITWCGDNSDKCVHLDGLLDRIQSNYMYIASILYDIYEQATRDTLCENQIDGLIAYGKIAEDIGKGVALKHGFNMEFDAEKELPKESLKEQYHLAKQKAYDVWPEHPTCPFRPIIDAIHDAKHDMFENMKMQFGHHFNQQNPSYMIENGVYTPQKVDFLKVIEYGYSFKEAANVQNLHLF